MRRYLLPKWYLDCRNEIAVMMSRRWSGCCAARRELGGVDGVWGC